MCLSSKLSKVQLHVNFIDFFLSKNEVKNLFMETSLRCETNY